MFAECQQMAQVDQALLDFAVVHGRLPWAGEDGNEVMGRGKGALPWMTLGLKPFNLPQYQVSPAWADNTADPAKQGGCEIQETLNTLSVNFCSQGTLQGKQYRKVVAVVKWPGQHAPCDESWLSAEAVLGRLVIAGRLY
jgi:hypothetical protein